MDKDVWQCCRTHTVQPVLIEGVGFAQWSGDARFGLLRHMCMCCLRDQSGSYLAPDMQTNLAVGESCRGADNKNAESEYVELVPPESKALATTHIHISNHRKTTGLRTYSAPISPS